MDDAFNEAGTAFAIVSPCSQCQNQRSAVGTDGKPLCPRRKWQQDQLDFQNANNGNSDPRLIPLALYGTEDTPQAGDQSLRNPVYWNESNSTLVWIATLRDNSGVRDANNNVVAPSILDPSFTPGFTDYINCRKIPYIPAIHEAAYRTSGGLKEGDALLAITTQNQQNYSQVTTDSDVDDPSEYKQVLIEGVVQKVNLAYSTPRASVDTDYIVQGS